MDGFGFNNKERGCGGNDNMIPSRDPDNSFRAPSPCRYPLEKGIWHGQDFPPNPSLLLPPSRKPLVLVCMCMFLLVSCLGGLQGFKFVWTDLAALTYDIAHCKRAENDSAVSWLIVGHFKA